MMVHILIANRESYETNGMEWLLKANDPSITIRHAVTIADLQDKLESAPIDILIFEMEFLEFSRHENILKLIKVLDPKIIGLTIESTFEVAMRAIELGVKKLLLKPISPEQLQNNVQKMVREIRFKAIESKEPILNEEGININQLFIDEVTPADDYVFLGFKAESSVSLRKLSTFLQDYSYQRECKFFFLSEVIIGISKGRTTAWYEECLRLLRDWNKTNSDSISIVTLVPNEEKLTFSERYRETIKQLEVTFYIGFNQVLQTEQRMNWKMIDPFLTSSEQKLWIDFLNQSNLPEIREWLYREFLRFELPYPDPALIRIRLTSILAQIRRYLKEHTIFQNLEAEYLSLFNDILYSTIIYRNVQELVLFCSKIFDLKEQIRDQKKDIIEICYDYIKTHYWNSQLTLEGIATSLNRNPTYISNLFVKKTGVTFREALNEVRIENAKNLLKETSMTVKEIASLSGFTHQQYFTKVFRQKTNQTPNQFRAHYS
jgi:two-component system, response regulator YesN